MQRYIRYAKPTVVKFRWILFLIFNMSVAVLYGNNGSNCADGKPAGSYWDNAPNVPGDTGGTDYGQLVFVDTVGLIDRYATSHSYCYELMMDDESDWSVCGGEVTIGAQTFSQKLTGFFLDWLAGIFGAPPVTSLIDADTQTITARSAAVKVKIELHNTYRLDDYIGAIYDNGMLHPMFEPAIFGTETPHSGPYYLTVEECCEEAE